MAHKSWQPKDRFKDRVRRRRGKRPTAGARVRDTDGHALLYGWHTVKAALENPARRFRRLLATENALRRLADDGIALPLKPELVRPDVIDAQLGPDAVHQGLLAETDPLAAPALAEISQDGIVLVLDQITDPHNVGAILRSAAAFGAIGIVTQDRHSPPESGVVAKASSGALERVPWVRVVNLARALEEIAEAGFWRIGLTGDAQTELKDALGPSRVALVLGAEGPGLRQNTREHCDALARLPIGDAVESLNVSNAAAVALYAASAH